MSKHTPGPWLFARQDDDDGDIYWAVHAAAEYQFITNVHSSKEDARLIALAPEMLDALRLLTSPSMGETRYPGTDRESTHIGWQEGPTAHERVKIARAILAKLDGAS